MSARWRSTVRRLIGQFCAHEGWLHGVSIAGGPVMRSLPRRTAVTRAGPGQFQITERNWVSLDVPPDLSGSAE